MDSNSVDPSLVYSVEKKKYRARGCRGGSKNKKRLENKLAQTELSACLSSFPNLNIESDEVGDTENNDECTRSLRQDIDLIVSVSSQAPNAVQSDSTDVHYSLQGSTQDTYAIPNNSTHHTFQENNKVKKFGHVPKSSSSSTIARITTAAVTRDYYTKQSMDPNVTFDSINKLNQGYSSSSVSSSLMFRESPVSRETVFPKLLPETPHPSLEPTDFKISSTMSSNVCDIDRDSPNELIPNDRTSFESSNPYRQSFQYNLFLDEPSNIQTIDCIGSKRHGHHRESSDSTPLNYPNRMFEMSGYRTTPSICDTSASSSTISTKDSPTFHDRYGTYNHVSVPSLSSYPLQSSSDLSTGDPLSQTPPRYFYLSDSTSQLSLPNTRPKHTESQSSFASLPISNSRFYSSDSTSNQTFPTIFEDSIDESDITFLSLPVCDSALHRELTPPCHEPIPRKIMTDSSKKIDIYSHCLNQTRSQDYFSGKRQILPSWSIESTDDRTSIKTVDKKTEKGPSRVPLRLSSLPPIISNSYSSRRDNQYGNNQTVDPTTNSTVTQKNNHCQYTGALETFYRSFLPTQPDFLCNSNVFSEPNDEAVEEQSFFNYSPQFYLFGRPEDKDSKRNKR